MSLGGEETLTFLDPDEDGFVRPDTQADEFRFQFTLPSQDYGVGVGVGLNSLTMSASLDDEQLKDGIRMVNIKQTMI
jgi:hypothetical protein